MIWEGASLGNGHFHSRKWKWMMPSGARQVTSCNHFINKPSSQGMAEEHTDTSHQAAACGKGFSYFCFFVFMVVKLYTIKCTDAKRLLWRVLTSVNIHGTTVSVTVWQFAFCHPRERKTSTHQTASVSISRQVPSQFLLSELVLIS